MASVIVFSKDRPMQLHAYLESILHFSDIEEHQISIIYVESDHILYDRVKCEFPAAKWIRQKDFYADTLSCIQDAEDVVMFGCDDVIFTGVFNIQIIEEILGNESSIWGFSLRLVRNIAPFPPQAIVSKDFCIWDWTMVESPHFAYPWELDCTLYRKEDVLAIMNRIGAGVLRNQNDLEAVPANNAQWLIPKKRMCAYMQSKAFVITVNRVQDDYPNIYDNTKKTDVQTLAELYNREGKTLDVERIAELSGYTNRIHVGADFFLLRGEEASCMTDTQESDYEKDKRTYARMAMEMGEKDFPLNEAYDFPCLEDKKENAGCWMLIIFCRIFIWPEKYIRIILPGIMTSEAELMGSLHTF